MQRAFLVAVSAVLLLASAVPAGAGTIYVALASKTTQNGVELETVLQVANPTAEARSFTALFIPTFTNGADRDPDQMLPEIQVGAGQIREIRGLADGAEVGLLEIEADDALAFSARLVSTLNGVEQIGAPVPIVSSRNIVEGGRTFHIQGLLRDTDHVTNFGLISFSNDEVQCSTKVFRPDGTQLVSALLVFKPLEHRQFNDVLNLIGVTEDADSRLELSCPGPAYAYAHVVNNSTGGVAALNVSATGNSTLRPPGGSTTSCSPGATCFEEPGIFYVPAGGSEKLRRNYSLPPGQRFSVLRVRMTVQHGGWDSRSPNGLHNFFWVARNKWQSNTFAYLTVRGPNRNRVINLQNAGRAPKDDSVVRVDRALQPGQTYVIEYTYDTNTRRVTALITTIGGTEVARLTDSAALASIVTEGAGFFVEWGHKREFEEVPTYGWVYQDFLLELIP